MFFFLNYCYFSELWEFCCSAGFLPALCVYTHWHRGKTEKGQSPEYFKIFEKTQYSMNTLYHNCRTWRRVLLFSGWPALHLHPGKLSLFLLIWTISRKKFVLDRLKSHYLWIEGLSLSTSNRTYFSWRLFF